MSGKSLLEPLLVVIIRQCVCEGIKNHVHSFPLWSNK